MYATPSKVTAMTERPILLFPATEAERVARRDRRAERALQHARGRRTGRAFPRPALDTNEPPEAA